MSVDFYDHYETDALAAAWEKTFWREGSAATKRLRAQGRGIQPIAMLIAGYGVTRGRDIPARYWSKALEQMQNIGVGSDYYAL